MMNEVIKQDCAKCERQPDLKKAWHCEPQKEIKYVLYPHAPWRIELNHCPLRGLPVEVFRVCYAWHYFKKGVMPFGGGLLDQPALLIDSFSALDRFTAELERDV
ncbi:MAG: hypothetical protein U9Q07_04790 [Planctomycetota bacterium]|nr:hypothetical protein [Planctomycetota bacterium]